MLKFRSHLQSYQSIDDFKQSCLERFESVKKELTDILGVDCHIELSSFNPQFSIEPFYLESFHYSLRCFEYVMTFASSSYTFDDTLIGLTNLRLVHLDKDLNLDSVELKHTDIGKISTGNRSFSGINISYSIPESCAHVIVKHSPDVSEGRLIEDFTRDGTLMFIIDEATSILNKFKESVNNSTAKLEPVR